jgi:hypothetical protein
MNRVSSSKLGDFSVCLPEFYSAIPCELPSPLFSGVFVGANQIDPICDAPVRPE